MAELRYALRSLRRRAGSAAVVIVTLAISIGATTIIASLVEFLLHAIPVADASRLAFVSSTDPRPSQAQSGMYGAVALSGTSVPDLVDWMARVRSIDEFVAYRYDSATLRQDSLPERVRVVRTTANLTEVFGLTASTGRLFRADESRPGAPGVVLLSDRFWRQRFGADRDIVGTSLLLDGVAHDVFSMFDRLLLSRLAVTAPEELVNLSSPGPHLGNTSTNSAGAAPAVFTYPLFRDLERIQTPFTALGGFRDISGNGAYRGETTSARGLLVSGGNFAALRLRPAHGRLLTADDDRDGSSGDVAVLAHAYWTTRFGANPAVLNVPLRRAPRPIRDVDLPALGSRDTVQSREEYVKRTLVLSPGLRGHANDQTETRRVLSLLFLVTGFVLLIAYANVGNLLLVRGTERTVEVRMRVALGASTLRVLRLVFAEASLLSLVGDRNRSGTRRRSDAVRRYSDGPARAGRRGAIDAHGGIRRSAAPSSARAARVDPIGALRAE